MEEPSEDDDLIQTISELRSWSSKRPKVQEQENEKSQDDCPYDKINDLLDKVSRKLTSKLSSPGRDNDVHTSNQVMPEFHLPTLEGGHKTYKSTDRLGESTLLHQLMTQSHICDMTLAADGQAIRAHWSILVSCPYFEAMDSFQEKCRPNQHSCYIDVDFCSFPTLREIVYYLYTETVRINMQNVYRVIKAADFLQISSLVQHCVFFLKSQALSDITFETGAMFYHLAVKYDIENLADKCISCITSGLPVDTMHALIASHKMHHRELVRFFVECSNIADDPLIEGSLIAEELIRRYITNGLETIGCHGSPSATDTLRVYGVANEVELCYTYNPIKNRWKYQKTKTKQSPDSYCKAKKTLCAMRHIFTELLPQREVEDLLGRATLEKLTQTLSSRLMPPKKMNGVTMESLAEQIFGQMVMIGMWGRPEVAVDVFVMPAKINGMETMSVFVPNESRWARVPKLDLLKYSRLQFIFTDSSHTMLFYCSRERLLRFKIRENETTTIANRVCEYGETVIGMWSAYDKIYVAAVQRWTSAQNVFEVRLCIRQVGSDATLKTLYQSVEYECVWYRFQHQGLIACARYICLFCYFATERNMSIMKTIYVWDCLRDEGFSADEFVMEMFTQDSLRKLLIYEIDEKLGEKLGEKVGEKLGEKFGEKLGVWLSGSRYEYQLKFADRSWTRIEPSVKHSAFLSDYNRFRSLVYNDCWYLFGYKPKSPIGVAVKRPLLHTWNVYETNGMSVALTGYAYNSPVMLKVPVSDICHI